MTEYDTEYLTTMMATVATPGQGELSDNAANASNSSDSSIRWIEVEAYYLYILAAVGALFNFLIIVSILCCKHLRKMTNAFIIHQCLIDSAKCALCIPFAASLLSSQAPKLCDMIAGGYVILVTVSTFNLLAMVSTEAYTFRDAAIGGEDAKGTICCITFGILMVYIGSIIIHLGPTLIGGTFAFNTPIGNCIFAYGGIQNYVIHCIWITIVSFSLLLIFYYLISYYRNLKSSKLERVAAFVRHASTYSKGQSAKTMKENVNMAISRAKIYIVITVAFIICWYPLFSLTLIDKDFKQSGDLYRLLSLLAWSNAAVSPIILLFFDKSFSVFCRLSACCRKETQIPNRDESSLTLMRDSSTMSSHINDRAAARLFEETVVPGPSTSCNGNSPEHRLPPLLIQPSFVPNRHTSPLTHYYYSESEEYGQ